VSDILRLHYLQHVPFEDLANIEVWAKDNGHTVTKTLLFDGEKLPDLDDLEFLVIMGGPMNIYEEGEYSWLVEEKNFIREAISAKKLVLGICLGAQLIADVLGAKIYKNRYDEIGWFPITLTEEAEESPIFGRLPKSFIALHWHGDTFDIPHEARLLAKSEGCINQAFEYKGHVLGLQFHLESSPGSVEKLAYYCGGGLKEAKYVQMPEEILSKHKYFTEIENTMKPLLDRISDQENPP